jgi:hypothetical protein
MNKKVIQAITIVLAIIMVASILIPMILPLFQ